MAIRYKDIQGTLNITEEVFEEISEFLLGATKDLTEDLLQSIGCSWADITGVILVGGSTRMRMIHKYVEAMSGKEPLSGVNVDEAVALGAAIRANIDDSGKTVQQSFMGLLSGKKKVEVIGAKKVTDVTAHALGMIAISKDGESYENSVIIPKNSAIPVSMNRSYNFKTRAKNNELEVYVLQGAYRRPLDNIILDRYTISGIERTNSNTSVIEVSYQYNANGVVDVSAVQKETGKQLSVRIEKIPEDMSWTDGSPKDQLSSSAPSEVEVLLAIDLSGSMSGSPVEKAKEAMEQFVRELGSENAKIGLLSFADKVRLVVKPTKNEKQVIQAIRSIHVGEVGGGNSAEPFTDALFILKRRLFTKEDIARYLIVLTDGAWNNPTQAITKAKQCHAEGIEVIALGFGSAVKAFLESIASIDEFASLTDLSELSGSFSKIAQTIGDGSGGSIKEVE